MLTAAVIAGAATGLARLAANYLTPEEPRTTYGPCTTADGQNTQLVLPEANKTCPDASGAHYTVAYFAPRGSPENSGLQRLGTITVEVADSNEYELLGPSRNATLWGPSGPGSTTNAFLDSASGPINLCPQTRAATANGRITGATAVALPMPTENESRRRSAHNGLTLDVRAAQASRVLLAIPGLSSAGASGPNNPNPINVPAVGQQPGLCNILYLLAERDADLYLEVGGARGGDVPLYTSGIDPTTGVAAPLTPGFVGGSPGVVYGLYSVKTGDVLKVFLGTAGAEVLQTTEQPANGQGGLGTLFGGANGGGASYVVHYKASTFGRRTFDAAFNNRLGGTLVCVAAGGGGASRNASGGSAGFCETSTAASGQPAVTYGALEYGGRIETSDAGSAGGDSFVVGPAPLRPGLATNQLSGGGGVSGLGGKSNVPSPISPRACFGSKLVPFATASSAGNGGGGGSVVTDIGSGGGGGGSGLYGGGAGGYNGFPKPNNVHGGGGGGASWTGALKKTSRGAYSACLNPLRSSLYWPNNVRPWQARIENSENGANGYLVIVLSNAQQ